MTASAALAKVHDLGRYSRTAPAPPTKDRALILSGGGNLCFFHLGVIKVLHKANLLPRVLSGTSAASSIAAAVATRSESDLRGLHEDQFAFIGFREDQPRKQFTIEDMRELLEPIIPDVTFAEAQEISGRALNIPISERDGGGGVVCGPKSTPNVLVRDAILASSAVPFVFEPVQVCQRRNGNVVPFCPGRLWVDGSLYADVPASFIKHNYGVRYAIVSLVNPAIRPFVKNSAVRTADRSPKGGPVLSSSHTAILGAARLGRSSAASMPKTRYVFHSVCRMFEQPYVGDLVLTPSRRLAVRDVFRMSPSSDLVHRLSADGEARTRERLPDIRALDR